jgi:hypothetical protein
MPAPLPRSPVLVAAQPPPPAAAAAGAAAAACRCAALTSAPPTLHFRCAVASDAVFPQGARRPRRAARPPSRSRLPAPQTTLSPDPAARGGPPAGSCPRGAAPARVACPSPVCRNGCPPQTHGAVRRTPRVNVLVSCVTVTSAVVCAAVQYQLTQQCPTQTKRSPTPAARSHPRPGLDRTTPPQTRSPATPFPSAPDAQPTHPPPPPNPGTSGLPLHQQRPPPPVVRTLGGPQRGAQGACTRLRGPQPSPAHAAAPAQRPAPQPAPSVVTSLLIQPGPVD